MTHGHCSGDGVQSPTYRSWASMKDRCQNPNRDRYDDYGGRGIKVCDRWNKFENFLADMGERPDGTSIDRIDNDGNYEPGNCRWATQAQQNRNQRPRRPSSVGPYGRRRRLSGLDARIVRAVPAFVGVIRVLAAEFGVSEVEIMYARART